MGPCLLLLSHPGRSGGALREESAAWPLRAETGCKRRDRALCCCPRTRKRGLERGDTVPDKGTGPYTQGYAYSYCLSAPALLLGKRKIHYQFEDGKEMAEEYDMKTGQLVSKWGGRSVFAGLEWWEALSGQEGSAPKYSRKNCSWSSYSLLQGHNYG